MVSFLKRQTHEDFLYVRTADECVTSTDAFHLKAERFVQSTRPLVRREYGELRFPYAAVSHPLQDPRHEDAAQSDASPSVSDGDPDSADVTRFRERPSFAVGRTDHLPASIRHHEDLSRAIEGTEPWRHVVEIRDLVDHDVDFFLANQVHIPKEGLRISEARRPDDDLPAVFERDLLGPHRVGHGRHSGNLSSISGRRRSPLARNASICSFSWGVSSA